MSCNEKAPLAAPVQPQVEKGVEPFLKACLKLLRNPQAVGNLLALLNTRTAQPTLIPKTKDVHKLYSYKKRTTREMRLTAQIREYEMDQVILDLGSDDNVLPKQT